MTVATGLLSPWEYLRRERKSENKNEFFEGQIYQMAGASRSYNAIAGNVFFITARFHH